MSTSIHPSTLPSPPISAPRADKYANSNQAATGANTEAFPPVSSLPILQPMPTIEPVDPENTLQSQLSEAFSTVDERNADTDTTALIDQFIAFDHSEAASPEKQGRLNQVVKKIRHSHFIRMTNCDRFIYQTSSEAATAISTEVLKRYVSTTYKKDDDTVGMLHPHGYADFFRKALNITDTQFRNAFFDRCIELCAFSKQKNANAANERSRVGITAVTNAINSLPIEERRLASKAFLDAAYLNKSPETFAVACSQLDAVDLRDSGTIPEDSYTENPTYRSYLSLSEMGKEQFVKWLDTPGDKGFKNIGNRLEKLRNTTVQMHNSGLNDFQQTKKAYGDTSRHLGLTYNAFVDMLLLTPPKNLKQSEPDYLPPHTLDHFVHHPESGFSSLKLPLQTEFLYTAYLKGVDLDLNKIDTQTENLAKLLSSSVLKVQNAGFRDHLFKQCVAFDPTGIHLSALVINLGTALPDFMPNHLDAAAKALGPDTVPHNYLARSNRDFPSSYGYKRYVLDQTQIDAVMGPYQAYLETHPSTPIVLDSRKFTTPYSQKRGNESWLARNYAWLTTTVYNAPLSTASVTLALVLAKPAFDTYSRRCERLDKEAEEKQQQTAINMFSTTIKGFLDGSKHKHPHLGDIQIRRQEFIKKQSKKSAKPKTQDPSDKKIGFSLTTMEASYTTAINKVLEDERFETIKGAIEVKYKSIIIRPEFFTLVDSTQLLLKLLAEALPE